MGRVGFVSRDPSSTKRIRTTVQSSTLLGDQLVQARFGPPMAEMQAARRSPCRRAGHHRGSRRFQVIRKGTHSAVIALVLPFRTALRRSHH